MQFCVFKIFWSILMNPFIVTAKSIFKKTEFHFTISNRFGSHMQTPLQNCSPGTNEKIYNEVMLNGGHINQNMQQFMEKDRCVARFFAIVDDLITPQFERRPFIIMYPTYMNVQFESTIFKIS